MSRTRGRVDGNHAEVIRALNEAGMSTLSLAPMGNGCPDVLVGFRGANFLLEVKDGAKPPSARALTAAELDFISTWGGHVSVVASAEHAVSEVVSAAKGLGLV